MGMCTARMKRNGGKGRGHLSSTSSVFSPLHPSISGQTVHIIYPGSSFTFIKTVLADRKPALCAGEKKKKR